MPIFLRTCRLAVTFKTWLTSPGGGVKASVQAEKRVAKVLKYTKFRCSGVSTSWEIPDAVIDYCLGSITTLRGLNFAWIKFRGFRGFLIKTAKLNPREIH